MDDFIASEGDSFNVLKQGKNVQNGENDLVAAKLYFRVKGLVDAPAEKRITRVP